MTDEQHLDVIEDAFAAFRAGGPLGTPLGSGAVRATVRRRRQVRSTAVAAVAALAVVTPTALYAAGAFEGKTPHVAASAGPSVSAGPTAPASPAPSADASASTPDGRIADPANATLPLPSWPTFDAGNSYPCSTGPTTFVDGVHTASKQTPVELVKSVYLDVDADGAQETVVLFRCSVTEIGYVMVAAFDKDAAGTVTLLGKVVQNAAAGIKGIDDLRVAGAAVEAHVWDYGTPSQVQWRAYSWNGSAFTQTGGPTSFPSMSPPADPHRTKLSISTTATEITLTKNTYEDNRLDAAPFTVTIRNDGPVATSEARIILMGNGLGNWSVLVGGDIGAVTCGREASRPEATYCTVSLGVGESKSLTFNMIVEGYPLADPSPDDHLWIGADTAPSQFARQGYQEPVSLTVPAKVAS